MVKIRDIDDEVDDLATAIENLGWFRRFFIMTFIHHKEAKDAQAITDACIVAYEEHDDLLFGILYAKQIHMWNRVYRDYL